MDSIKIEQLVKDTDFDLRLELLAGENGLDRRVVSSRIQKPGLALSGFTEHIHKDRLQVFGNTEISFLSTLKHDEAMKRVRNLFQLPIACLVVTKNLPVEDWMKREAGLLDARGDHAAVEAVFAAEELEAQIEVGVLEQLLDLDRVHPLQA